MALPLLGLTPAVQMMVTAAQGFCSSLLNVAVGSVLNAVFKAFGGVALWLQWLILQVQAQTRLSTSAGPDVDSFVGDFGLTRLPGVQATGALTFSRITATQPILIPVGTQAITADRSVTAAVTADSTNSLWNGSGYLVPAGTASATVPAQATAVGTTGNAAAGSFANVASSIAFDSVTNGVAFTGGVNEESDAALRLRFVEYIGSLASAINSALLAAANAVQQGLKLQLANNVPLVGQYTLFVDDGSGNAPDGLISAVTTAVQAVTAEGVQPYVMRPNPLVAAVALNVIAAPTANASMVQLNVTNALNGLANGIPIGGVLSFFGLSAAAFAADPNVQRITAMTLNGGSSDLAASVGQLIELDAPTVSVTLAQ
jgi:hypothetical protein